MKRNATIAFGLVVACAAIAAGQETQAVASPKAKPLAGAATARGGKEVAATKVVARVGDEVILAGDLFGQVNQFLYARMQEMPAEQRAQLNAEMLDAQRWKLIRQLLPQVIDGKLIYLDFLRTIPKERLPDLQDSLFRAFDEQQLPVLIERAQVSTAADLDRQLRGFGSSLEQQRLMFAEQLAAVQWKGRHATSDREVTHEELLSFYREHRDEFRIDAKAKFEQLSAHDGTTGSRLGSRQAIAKMGNEVFRGAAFAAVARRSSHGPTASRGGAYDWTTKDSLRSEVINKAIFQLPVGRLSQILEDDDGCHIVRVTERQDESFVPFSEAQASIQERIQQARAKTAEAEYVAGLRDKFPVWTMFDGEVARADAALR